MSIKYGTARVRLESRTSDYSIGSGVRVAVLGKFDNMYLVRRIYSTAEPFQVMRSHVKLDSHKKHPWYEAIVKRPVAFKINAPYSDRILYDLHTVAVVKVSSTLHANGSVSPTEAGILGHVLAEYVHSERFRDDWKRIAEKHFRGHK